MRPRATARFNDIHDPKAATFDGGALIRFGAVLTALCSFTAPSSVHATFQEASYGE